MARTETARAGERGVTVPTMGRLADYVKRFATEKAIADAEVATDGESDSESELSSVASFNDDAADDMEL